MIAADSYRLACVSTGGDRRGAARLHRPSLRRHSFPRGAPHHRRAFLLEFADLTALKLLGAKVHCLSGVANFSSTFTEAATTEGL